MDTYKYIVPITKKASREEIEWAWRFTILSRANGRCEACGKEKRLDCAHIESRRDAPDREFDPDNAQALCRSCHMAHDHANGHRPSGRPVGYKMSQSFKDKMRRVGKRRAEDPAFRQFLSKKATAWWDDHGRKTAPRPCENCGATITGHRQYAGNRFCSPKCHYAFRSGKPRTGY